MSSWTKQASISRGCRSEALFARSVGCFCLALIFAGCLVRASRYDQAVHEGNIARNDSLRANGQIRTLQAELATTRTLLQARETKLAELEAATNNLQARLDEATALHQQLQKELERLGKNVGAMLENKGVMQQALDDAKIRLAELRALQTATQARNAAMISLARLLNPLENAKKIQVTTHEGHTVLVIPGSVLFEPGRAEVKRSGEGVLDALARALSTSPDWQLRIVAYSPGFAGKGHLRNVFDLPALRACHVTDRLVVLGLAPSSLSVSGYVDSLSAHAISLANEDANGRVEIDLVAIPNPAVPAVPAAPVAPMPTAPKAPQ